MPAKKLYFPIILLLAVCFQSSLAQDAKPVLTKEQAAKIGLLLQPVVYGTKSDNLPRKMKVRGVIEEVTFVPAACGVACWSGTVKIKLLHKIKSYRFEYVYVTVLCLTGKEEDFINKAVKVKVSKLEKDKNGCEVIVNAIDSQGVAFYSLDKNQSFR